MSAISIHLPGTLARASQKLATRLHMSRAQFIRMAIEHEIRNWEVQQERLAMAKSFAAMVDHKGYLQESGEIMDGMKSDLQDDEEQWWKEK
ncbi:MAG: hypothetical protein Q8L78_09110 [Coxiellaceae bacterium]|nr:hypothetical protein [Coxiellaceae bacterium]